MPDLTTKDALLERAVDALGSIDDNLTTTLDKKAPLDSPALTGDATAENLTVSGTLTGTLTGNADTATALNVSNIASSTDLDNLTADGRYRCQTDSTATSLSHCPTSGAFWMDVCKYNVSQGYVTQVIYDFSNIYMRRKRSGGWTSWYKFTGTAV